MPMQLQAGHRAAPLAEPMYLRFNACIGLAAERPQFPLACLSGDSGQAESWNTNALLNRWHVNPVSLSASTYSATVVQQGGEGFVQFTITQHIISDSLVAVW